MKFVIFVDGLGLGGDQATRAIEAATRHFEQAGIEPFEAAYAAWLQEGEQQDITDEQAQWAEVWRAAPRTVAKALGVNESAVDVNLDRAAG